MKTGKGVIDLPVVLACEPGVPLAETISCHLSVAPLGSPSEMQGIPDPNGLLYASYLTALPVRGAAVEWNGFEEALQAWRSASAQTATATL